MFHTKTNHFIIIIFGRFIPHDDLSLLRQLLLRSLGPFSGLAKTVIFIIIIKPFMHQSRKPNVIIIGGGISGIGAARTLYQAGFCPILLESRLRLGGRICKEQVFPKLRENEESAKGNFINVQFGANWIHGLDDIINPMFNHAKLLGLLLHPTSSDDEPGDDVLLFDQCLKDDSGDPGSSLSESLYSYSLVSGDDYSSVLTRYKWIKDNFEDVSKSLFGKSLQEAFEATIEASDAVFGLCSAAHKRCLNWFLDRVAIDMGAPLQQVDKATYIEGDSEGLYGEAVVIDGGYYRIFESLADEFPLDVRLGAAVTKIDWTHQRDRASSGPMAPDASSSGKAVKVSCADGRVFEADACVLTVPLGVLPSIEFAPRLPADVSALMRQLRPGLMNLVWLWFPARFWPVGYNFIGLARPSAVRGIQFTTFLAPPVLDRFGAFQPVLMSQVVGEYAEALESLSDEAIAAAATQLLRSMFACPGSQVTVPDPIGCGHSAWKSEQFSRGSWSLYPHVEQPNAEAAEAEEEAARLSERPGAGTGRCDCIVYAGEAVAADHRGTVHGAFQSGVAQAQRLVGYLQHQPPLV